MPRVKLTAGRIADFECRSTTTQCFLWDTLVPSLAVRATKKTKAFVFQGNLNKKDLRMTIGNVRVWGIDDARNEAQRLSMLVNRGIDPRLDKKRQVAETISKQLEEKRSCALLSDAWDAYILANRHKWSERYLLDHHNLSRPGGEPKLRGKGTSTPGPLADLMPEKLSDISAEAVKSWLSKESAIRPAQARQAFGVLRACLNWCDEQEEYKGLANPDSCSSRVSRNSLPKKKAKSDCLQKEQLPAWFTAVIQLPNSVISAYLQMLLLTGARRNELTGLRWKDIDFRWKVLTIKDKVDGERSIPLTPYTAYLLSCLFRKSEFVFANDLSKTGHIVEPRIPHNRALTIAGIESLTLHGLRRSFGTLSEWIEVPAGIVAQIQGHKPSATAEKHYRVRPIDLLRKWHVKIEAWMLEEAGVEFNPNGVVVGINSIQTLGNVRES